MSTMVDIETAPELGEREKGPSRKELRKAAKAAAKLERKMEKARKKAWKKARPKKHPWVAPILWVSDVRAHAGWCERAFGFEVAGIMDGPDGTAEHAMLRHRRGVIMLGRSKDAQLAPPSGGKSSTTQYVYVGDVDDLALRATSAGAKLVNPPRDEHWGDRCVPLVDPEGHSWMFATHKGECAGDQTPDCPADAPADRHASA